MEREGYAFDVTVVYEQLPEFCSNCYSIGHYVALCNKLHSKSTDDKPKAEKHKKKGDSSKQPITIHDDQPPRDPPKIQRCCQQMYLRMLLQSITQTNNQRKCLCSYQILLLLLMMMCRLAGRLWKMILITVMILRSLKLMMILNITKRIMLLRIAQIRKRYHQHKFLKCIPRALF